MIHIHHSRVPVEHSLELIIVIISVIVCGNILSAEPQDQDELIIAKNKKQCCTPKANKRLALGTKVVVGGVTLH